MSRFDPEWRSGYRYGALHGLMRGVVVGALLVWALRSCAA